MIALTLRNNPSREDDEWKFTLPLDALARPHARQGEIWGKSISFTAEAITLRVERFSSNRILRSDDPSEFVKVSFGSLRFPETSIKVTAEYITRFMEKGLFLNGAQYRFYHHSNSQLRERSCYMRRADSDAQLDEMIYPLGDFGKIMVVSKRAKRIGLLFSSAELDMYLDPNYVGDIPDLKSGDTVFSDGCGLISRRLAVQISKRMKIVFRGQRYTPTVYQIRYLGYKGVLMLHPALDAEKKPLAEFRSSMKKFTTTADHTFSVVNYSKPYSFGRLNNDVIVLLSSLGISDDTLRAKQKAYFDWIKVASLDHAAAVDLLSCLNQYNLASRVLLKGLDDPHVQRDVSRVQHSEIAGFNKEGGKFKSRMIIHNSRRLFGVCDPFRVLREGEVHIRITVSRKGATTPIHGDVLVVRNPCLHPGDCLKLRAVHYDKLSHLVDCVVFASVAKPGHQAAPAMSSGGDLDGDEYFVCWDKDLVPRNVAQSYDYPPNKEYVSGKITRKDMANYFASYNNVGVAKVSALHAKWLRASPKGALSVECQELNALHSKSVDGGKIKIPDRLLTPPEPTAEFIIDLLETDAREFKDDFLAAPENRAALSNVDVEDGGQLVRQLLQSSQNALSEYELANFALEYARKRSLDTRVLLKHIDFSALTTQQKNAISTALQVTGDEHPEIWNSLIRSDILTPGDLYQRSLGMPFRIHRLYSSKTSGLKTFFEYLKMGVQEYTRKLIVIQTQGRFAVGIFMRGSIAWDEDPEVNENVVVCSFLPQTSATVATLRPCKTGYRLHCSDVNFQLYNKHRGDTFIFMTAGGPKSDVSVSIALQKISSTVQRQVGRMYREEVKAIEIHVVSNRDRVAHQLFDLWFEHVPTEEFLKRFDRKAQPYSYNDIREVDWSVDLEQYPPWMKGAFFPINGRHVKKEPPKHTEETMRVYLSTLEMGQIERVFQIGLKHHAEDEIYLIFNYVASQVPIRLGVVRRWLKMLPPLAFALLKVFPPWSDAQLLKEELEPIAYVILRSIIRSADRLGIASLVALEKLAGTIRQLHLEEYFKLLMQAALCVRAPQLVQEVLLVLNDCRMGVKGPQTDDMDIAPAMKYGYKHALGIAFERAEEAADECPCDEDGNLKKQRNSPAQAKLHFVEGKPSHVKVDVRLDARSVVRLHSHVRLKAASKPLNRWVSASEGILDGLVIRADPGEYTVKLFYPPPPETEEMDWSLYNAGSVATAKSMMDALLRLLTEKEASCRFYGIITGDLQEVSTSGDGDETPSTSQRQLIEELGLTENLNASQVTAVQSCSGLLSLIWGPPGTGKTTVVIQILQWLLRKGISTKILMTASTHNAVDNVLERFIQLNESVQLLREEQILRVATDQSKVNKSLKDYTIDARVGGDLNENNRLLKKAKERLESAVIVFTTCAGAGLGILRDVDFDIAIIDEASQITEPGALVPLVKGVKQAVLVGDHVQLRPTVRNMGKALEVDVSMLERLYRQNITMPGLSKTMLDVQYRFSKELNAFPSAEFYEGRLKTGNEDSAKILQPLTLTNFPWPVQNGIKSPAVFIQCSAEEDMGGRSKSNAGQVELIGRIIPLLTKKDSGEDSGLSVTVLTPYTKQIIELRHRLPSSIVSSTVDAFQGRESDIIVFSSVRCNVEGEIGFLDDPRRLNVMWTRARLALVLVGDRNTMSTNELWKRAIDACVEVTVPEVQEENEDFQ